MQEIRHGQNIIFQDETTPEPVPLSALQHAVYCLRQAALIHLERLWTENRFTAEGHILHLNADKPGKHTLKNVRFVTALPLGSKTLNIAGVADVVEFHRQKDGREIPYPVEYKRGKVKLHQADEVQLCAQALCLEEMTGEQVPEGALFYAETKRRAAICLDDELRNLTKAAIIALQEIFLTQKTPPPVYKADRCRACSLLELCLPKKIAKPVLSLRQKMIDNLDKEAIFSDEKIS